MTDYQTNPMHFSSVFQADNLVIDPSANIETLTHLRQQWEQQQTHIMSIKQQLVHAENHALAEIKKLSALHLEYPASTKIPKHLQHYRQELQQAPRHFEKIERQLCVCREKLSQIHESTSLLVSNYRSSQCLSSKSH